ncbi:MAG: Ig-like domain repeat protein [Anaerolineae bacterium]|nr:Ig-like domain repeat protein [Anaerolineae bacterium]
MKKQRIVTHILTLALLLSLVSALPVHADLTPGHLDTGFDPGSGLDNEVLATIIQPDGKVLVGGNFTTAVGVPRLRIARLHADGSLDPTFDPGAGADDRVRALAVQPDGKVIVGGSFATLDGTPRARIARLDADGSLDTSFDPGADGAVRAVAVQPDGKILLAGEFETVDGTPRSHIARLHTDGSLDTSFDPGTGPSGLVHDVALQPDGKVIIGGSFAEVGGVQRQRVARLHADGSLDTSFDPGTGADNWVTSVALQPDGKVLIAGNFTTVGGQPRVRIARLDADGSLDPTFDPGSGANAIVNTVEVQPDGRVIVGGAFATMDSLARARIARLDTDGSLDLSFDPGGGADATVWSVALQVDGKMLIAGNFATIDGTGRSGIARLNTDGSHDVGFDPGTGASNQVQAVVVQPDGKVLIGGYFTSVDGTTRNRIARLNANGSLDLSFNPDANSVVQDIVVQPDGKIVIVGGFTTVGGTPISHIARLDAAGNLDPSFNPGTGPDDQILAVAIHGDKVIIGGYFTTVDGTARNRIARLDADGSLDASFNPGAGADSWVLSVAVQGDGKVIIGGNFTTVGVETRTRIARLNADGTVDPSFDPGDGANAVVRAVAVQPDGEVIVAGSFTTVAGQARARIARLNADGSLDTGFDPGAGADNWIDALALQADGKVLAGGSFTTVDNVASSRIARLNADGSLDAAFDTSSGMDNTVYDVAIQPGGQVLVGGDFTGRIARLNGATPPAITSAVPPSEATVGVAYAHTFVATGYPFAPQFYVTGGSLPSGLSLDAGTGLLSGQPAVAGNHTFTVSACNYVAPCDTQQVSLVIAKGASTTTITAHTPHPSAMGQAVTVHYSVTAACATPTGNVTVSDGEVSCSGTVAAGHCTLALSTAGTRTLTATYAGDDNLNGSTSAGVEHTVIESYSVYLPVVQRNHGN